MSKKEEPKGKAKAKGKKDKKSGAPEPFVKRAAFSGPKPTTIFRSKCPLCGSDFLRVDGGLQIAHRQRRAWYDETVRRVSHRGSPLLRFRTPCRAGR